jgi:hypothetical protein
VTGNQWSITAISWNYSESSFVMNHEQTTTHKQQAEALAIQIAVKRLAEQGDLAVRCERLGLNIPAACGGKVRVAMFGKMLEMTPPDFDGVVLETGKPPKNADRVLALHYLLCDVPVVPEERWITFRDFSGGAFYWQPFLSRSSRWSVASAMI